MVAHLLRLKLLLLRNGLRRSPWQVVGLLLALLYGLVALVLVLAGIAGLAVVEDVGLRRDVLVAGGALLVLGWALLPLVAFGVDATLDPARFTLFPVPRRQLLAGLALAGLVGVPGFVTVVTVAASVVVWWRQPQALPVAAVGAVLAVALCVVGSRATTTALAPALSGRRSREVVGVVAVVLAVGVYIGFGRLTQGLGEGVDVAGLRGLLADLAAVLAWTPFGAAWAAPADAAQGRWGTAAARLLVLAAAVAVLTVVWDRAMAHALVRPAASAPAGAVARGLGLLGRLPATPTWAVAARCLTYWRRDPRYALSVLVVPVLPVVLWAFGAGAYGVLATVPLAAFLLGWSVSQDVSFDGTAFWLHVSAGLRGRDDRAGRVLGVGLLLVPLLVVLAVVVALLTGSARHLPAVLGAALGTCLTALGVASVVSALLVTRVQQAGESAFTTRQGASLAAVVSQLGGMTVGLVLAAPELVLAVLAVAWSSAPLGWVALLVGAVLGGLLLVVGVRWGGHLLDRRAPRLLQALVTMR
ncbi:hypothetical protein [Cellulomonas marina]|uniref:ABC-2 type transport system permease protein n=1 Tax=Cellulomonas marina TaxID=988821 RepID=A0A1I0ZIF2_9CELL|nr:hypothetical protein [Cellulomonas marina]GIG28590.1 hypothetical protein Cma02nite_11900 [Cellulomonas marina]SFB25132.1 ABC-2 type transport system permease protein [Cellulomonas marina]